MEAFKLTEELKLYAENKGWLWFNGNDEEANIVADVAVEVGQLVLWCDLQADESRATGNRLKQINYTGAIALGGKFDAGYTIADDHTTSANLDETFDQKMERRLTELLQTLSSELGSFSCSNQLQIQSGNYVYATDKFDTNFDFVVGTFNIEQDRFDAGGNTVDLTLDSSEGGTVQTFEGTQPQPKYSTVAINAIPNDGFNFVKWLINGVENLNSLTTVTMSKAKTAIAYFSGFFKLNISSVGNGSTNLDTGEYDLESSTTQQIEAIPDVDNKFDNWDIDGSIILDNPYSLFMDSAKTVIAYFSSLMQVIQEVFGTTPVNQQFIDQSGNGNNVTYKNVQVGRFVGNSYTKSNNAINYIEDGDFNIKLTIQLLGVANAYENICSLNGAIIIYGQRNSNNLLTVLLINSDNTYVEFNIESLLRDGTIYDIIISKTGSSLQVDVNDNVYNYTLTKPTKGVNDFFYIGRNAAGTATTYLKSNVMLVDFENEFDLNFQDGDDSFCVDTSGNGNDAEFMGGILSDFRGTYIDGIDSININNGYSRFQQIADPTKFIYAAYTDAGIPTQTSIAGYEAPIEIPKNVISDNNIIYDGVQVVGIETDATFNDINSLENSETIEITKDVNTVSNLKIKA